MVEEAPPEHNTNDDDFLDLPSIQALTGYHARLEALLKRRQVLTRQLSEHGKYYPPLLLDRALTYEALEYDDLAIFDAYTIYLLCLKRLSDEFVTDLEASDLNGQAWEPSEVEVRHLLVDILALLVRGLTALGATKDAQDKFAELREQVKLLEDGNEGFHQHQSVEKLLQQRKILRQTNATNVGEILESGASTSRLGLSRREIYPWSTYEPDRNSPSSVAELNTYLAKIAPSLEAKVTELPALDSTEQETDGKWLQLGLFAKHDLQPESEVLREKSVLTAIRPLDASICDACGQDLEGISFDEIQQCDGEDCDVTYCSAECKDRAVQEYHRPYITEDEDEEHDGDGDEEPEGESEEAVEVENEDLKVGDIDLDADSASSEPQTATVSAPFCGNTDLQTIGRPTNTSTAEWDLYFLLLTRTIAMSITQKTHPLRLNEIKYIWGDFTSSPTSNDLLLASAPSPSPSPPVRTLPFSLTHNVIHPLDFFTELAQSTPDVTPYSAFWLANFDPWILQTLYAKFRGVANAQQSTFDGMPEIAAVHLGWCLANHSCAPNVRWTPGGVRRFIVRSDQDMQLNPRSTENSKGEQVQEQERESASESRNVNRRIKAGEEVFSHYTDVRLSVQERRERLMEVLGGVCRCERCLRESAEAK